MSKTFKCGDIASIINSNNDLNTPKVKSKAKLSKNINDLIEENKDKVIDIDKINESIGKIDCSNNDDSDEDSETESKPKNKFKKKSETSEKMERTLFVGNLPTGVTTKDLKKTFRDFGKIESIRLRGAVPVKQNMPKKVAVITKKLHSGRDSIQAYIVYKSSENMEKALELNGSVFNGHHIRVDRTVNPVHDQSRSIFLGNLPYLTRDEDMFDFFEDCGEIEAVRVVRDSKTGVGKGFGFVTFKSKDSVILALERNDQKFKGRQLRILRAKDGHKSEKQNQVSGKQNRGEKSQTKPIRSSDKSGFKGISAKKSNQKINKKKNFKSIEYKKKQKNLAEILSK